MYLELFVAGFLFVAFFVAWRDKETELENEKKKHSGPIVIAEYDSSDGHNCFLLTEVSHLEDALMVQIDTIVHEQASASFDVVPHVQRGQSIEVEPRVMRDGHRCGNDIKKLLWASIPEQNPIEERIVLEAFAYRPGPIPVLVRYQDLHRKEFSRQFQLQLYKDSLKWLLIPRSD